MSTPQTAGPAEDSTSAPAAGTVATVTGARPADELGIVLPLEHLLADFATPLDTPEGWAATSRRAPEPGSEREFYEAPLGFEQLGDVSLGKPNRDNWRLTDEELATTELDAFHTAGGGTVVDATSIGLGRNPSGLRRLSERTGLSIVMGSGWYHPAWAPETSTRNVDDLSAQIVSDLTDGVDGIRAGIIGRLAALDPADDDERRLLVAAAHAQAITGAPLYLDHAHLDRSHAALALLRGEGADLTRVVLAGCGPLAPDVDALAGLAETGVSVLFDRIGRLKSLYSNWDDHDVAAALPRLASRGHTDRVLLSPGITEKIDLVAFGGTGYAFIARQFAMFLGWQGVDEQYLNQMTVENPRRLLAGAAAAAGGATNTATGDAQ